MDNQHKEDSLLGSDTLYIQETVRKGRQMENEDVKEFCVNRYGLKPKKIKTFSLPHEGWEMDNKGYLVTFKDMRSKVILTSHGSLYEGKVSTLEEYLDEYKTMVANLENVISKLK